MLKIAEYMNWIPSEYYEGTYSKQNGTEVYFDMNDVSECFNKMIDRDDVIFFLIYVQDYLFDRGMSRIYDLPKFLLQNPHNFFIVMDDWLGKK